jgi:hypothetical protein
VGKNLCYISISYKSDVSATLKYFFLGSGKVDAKDIRIILTRTVLAFNNAAGLG